MSDITQMARRLADLEQVRKNLNSYSHPDDLAGAIASALRYVGGTTETQAVVALLTDGLDAVISQQKRDMREALQ